jgi:dipeptidyl aminopeptidase/acylaminoacyl peptidase
MVLVHRFGFVAGVVLMVVVTGCGGSNAPAPTPTVIVQIPTNSPSATLRPSPTSTPTVMPTFTRTPTVTTTPTPADTRTPIITLTPTITPTHPLVGYTIQGLRERTYPGGTIEITHTITETDNFTKYLIRYPSDDLIITGMMNVPKGEGPFPVVVLNHGYIPPSRYWSGADTWRAADHLAVQGYLTISPDFRGWGGSDTGDNFFRTGLVIDVLNLISSLPSVPQADPDRVGMWGHSMGGGVTTKAITIDPRIRAAVLYAPVSADDTDVIRRWGRGGRGGGEDSMARVYQEASRDQDFLRLTSPIHHFDFVTTAVQIHQGAADSITPSHWAEAIWDALQAAGKEVEYYSYPGQGHTLEGESWDMFLQRITDFFEQTLSASEEAE